MYLQIQIWMVTALVKMPSKILIYGDLVEFSGIKPMSRAAKSKTCCKKKMFKVFRWTTKENEFNKNQDKLLLFMETKLCQFGKFAISVCVGISIANKFWLQCCNEWMHFVCACVLNWMLNSMETGNNEWMLIIIKRCVCVFCEGGWL